MKYFIGNFQLKELKRRVEVVEKERILLTDQINDLIVKNDYQDLKQDVNLIFLIF